MVAPSALLSIQDGSGAVENQGQGFIQELTPGDIATFALQTSANVTPGLRWVLVFESAFTPQLDGLAFVWAPPIGRASFQVQLPPFGFLARYVTTIYDGQNALSQFTGEIEGSEGGTSSVGGDVIGPIGSNLVTSAHIPANVALPQFTQTQATTTSNGQLMTMRAQSAKTGGAARGGDLAYIVGAADGAGFGQGNFIWFGEETSPGAGTPNPAENWYGYGVFKHLPGEVINLALGLGTDNVGGSVAGVEISAFSSLSLATEGANSPILFSPASSFGGQSAFTMAQNATDGQAIFSLTSQSDPAAASGIIRLGWAGSSTLQPIIEQRNGTNTGDLDIISRNTAQLYFGSYSEDHRIHGKSTIPIEIFDQLGIGVRVSGVPGAIWTMGVDANKTVSHGADTGKDGVQELLFSKQSNSTTAAQALTSTNITVVDNASTQLEVRLVGVDQTNGDTASFTLVSSFKSASGTVTQLTGGPAAIDNGHSAAATGVSPAFAIVSNKVAVQGTPWTTNNIHWFTVVRPIVNTGAF